MYRLNNNSTRELIEHSLIVVDDISALIKTRQVNTLVAIAKSATTDPEKLHQLLSSSLNEKAQAAIHQALAKNPNTLKKTLNGLTKIGGYPLLLLVVKHPTTSAEALNVLSYHKEEPILHGVAEHISTPETALLRLLNNNYSRVKLALAANVNMNEALLIAMLSAKLEPKAKSALLTNRHIPSETLLTLSQLPDESVQALVARNINTPLSALKSLSLSPSAIVKRAVASNPSLDEATLLKLATIARGDVWLGVAENPMTSAVLLHTLSLKGKTHLDRLIAAHPNCDSDTLDTLAKHDDAAVRKAVAAHPSISLSSLRMLAGDRETSVSREIALNTALGIVVELEESSKILKNSGYGCFDFYGVNSPKKVTTMFIGSKHPEEVAFIFNAKHCQTLQAISVLQSAFTNVKGKLDRHAYLAFITQVNTLVAPDRIIGLAVEAPALKTVKHVFGDELVLAIVMQYAPDEARDTIRMIATIANLPIETEREEELTALKAWLAKNSQKSAPACLHHHVSLKQRELYCPLRNVDFWQKTLNGHLQEAKKTTAKRHGA
jgi:hypothetical protein